MVKSVIRQKPWTLRGCLGVIIAVNLLALCVVEINRSPIVTAIWTVKNLDITKENYALLGNRLGDVKLNDNVSTPDQTADVRGFGRVPGKIYLRRQEGRIEEIQVMFTDYASEGEYFKPLYFDKRSVDLMYREFRERLIVKLGPPENTSKCLDELGYPMEITQWRRKNCEITVKKYEANDSNGVNIALKLIKNSEN